MRIFISPLPFLTFSPLTLDCKSLLHRKNIFYKGFHKDLYKLELLLSSHLWLSNGKEFSIVSSESLFKFIPYCELSFFFLLL